MQFVKISAVLAIAFFLNSFGMKNDNKENDNKELVRSPKKLTPIKSPNIKEILKQYNLNSFDMKNDNKENDNKELVKSPKKLTPIKSPNIKGILKQNKMIRKKKVHFNEKNIESYEKNIETFDSIKSMAEDLEKKLKNKFFAFDNDQTVEAYLKLTHYYSRTKDDIKTNYYANKLLKLPDTTDFFKSKMLFYIAKIRNNKKSKLFEHNLDKRISLYNKILKLNDYNDYARRAKEEITILLRAKKQKNTNGWSCNLL